MENNEKRKENLRKLLEDFTKNKEFMLNPDEKHVDTLLNGLLKNKKKHGLMYCPCRILANTKKDLELICPCNFFIHETYTNPKQGKSRCWCGLFIKKE